MAWKSALPSRFQPVGTLPAAVASAPVLTMTAAQKQAAHDKFMADAKAAIDAIAANGSCPLEATYQAVKNLCPF
jgi:hypothetical protein